MALMERSLVPLVGPKAAYLTVKVKRIYAVMWFEGTFVAPPLVVAVQLRYTLLLALAAALTCVLFAGLMVRLLVVHRKVAPAVREYVEATYGFRPRFTDFRNAAAAYGWLRLDQLYQAAGMQFSRTGTTKAYGTRWSRPRLIREMETWLRAEGRTLPPSLPIPRGWAGP